MIVRVIPIRRLPQQLNYFDYIVPTALHDTIAVGQLITMPLRKSHVFGVVFSIDPTDADPDMSLKKLASIVHETPLFDTATLQLWDTIATLHHVSVGTIAKMAMPPVQKRKLNAMEWRRHKMQESKMQADDKPTYYLYANENKHAERLTSAITTAGTTLILVPTVEHIGSVVSLLPQKMQERTLCWHSGLSTKEQFSAWFRVRNGDARVIIGTRGSVFLPFQQLRSIIIDEEQHEQHKHWDQAPRFDARDIAGRLQVLHGASLHLMSFSPSVASYLHVHKERYRFESNKKATVGSFHFSQQALPSVIDMAEERRAQRYEILADPVIHALKANHDDALFILNRRGYATASRCDDCGHLFQCPQCQLPLVYHKKIDALHCHYCAYRTKMPRVCPACQSTALAVFGVGVEQLAEFIRSHTDRPVTLIDSNTATDDLPSSPRVIVGTQAAFRHTDWTKTSLITFVDLDRQLAIPEYHVSESAWQTLQTTQYRRREDSELYIQSYNPKQLVLRSLSQPDRFYRTDLQHRKQLGYPPYRVMVRLMFAHADIRTARKQSKRVRQTLADILTKQQFSAILSGVIEMHPRWYRGKHWFVMLATFDPDTWEAELAELLRYTPSSWRVDPHPISILHP